MKPLAAFLLVSSFASGQPVAIGGRIGARLSRAFDPSQGVLSFIEGTRGGISYDSETRRLLVGPTVEFPLRPELSIEVGALYQRLHFEGREVRFTPVAPGFEGARGSSWSTSASLWEFPVLVKYRLAAGPARPYLSAGPCLSRVAAVRRSIECFDFLGSCRFDPVVEKSPELRRRSVAGAVLSGGVEFAVSRLRVSPEIRYVRYAGNHFVEPQAELIRSDESRVYLLLAISFGGRGR